MTWIRRTATEVSQQGSWCNGKTADSSSARQGFESHRPHRRLAQRSERSPYKGLATRKTSQIDNLSA